MKKFNLIDHLAGLLVVILGITIAFYLEGWREEKERRTQEVKYIESIISDLNADIEALDTLINVNGYITRSLVTLSNASINMPYSKDTTLRFHVLFIQYNPPFTPQNTIYESLKASGKMDLIDDFELQNEVIELYERTYLGAKQYDETLSEHVRDYIKPFFMENILYISPQEISDKFLDKNEFKNMIFAYRFLFTQKNDFYRRTLEDVEKVKVLLEERLALLGG